MHKNHFTLCYTHTRAHVHRHTHMRVQAHNFTCVKMVLQWMSGTSATNHTPEECSLWCNYIRTTDNSPSNAT